MGSIPESDRLVQGIEQYIATFAGRTDAYSVWANDQWRAVRKPLTANIVTTAFRTSIPVSAYVLAPDSTSHVTCLDVDREDGLALGKVVAAHVHSLGGISYVEASRRGSHVWTILDDVRPGILLRTALRQLIVEAGLPDDPKIELRPAHDHLSDPDSLGICIRMPTMPHPLTGKRYILVAGDGEKLPGKVVDMMAEIQLCPATVFDDLAYRGPAPKVGTPPKGLRYPYGEPVAHEDDESASEILREFWGAGNAMPNKLIHCPMGTHGSGRTPSCHILKDDQRVICFNPVCELHNNGHGRGTRELRAMAPARSA